MPKSVINFLLISICLSLFLSGCGVMFGGSKYSGTVIAKNHPDAIIYVNGNKVGMGTSVGLYPRNRPLTVELREGGCESKTQTFDNTLRVGNFILSLVWWGFLGIIIDLGTGAAYKPDHRGNPAIERITDKNFVFVVDYSECATPQ